MMRTLFSILSASPCPPSGLFFLPSFLLVHQFSREDWGLVTAVEECRKEGLCQLLQLLLKWLPMARKWLPRRCLIWEVPVNGKGFHDSWQQKLCQDVATSDERCSRWQSFWKRRLVLYPQIWPWNKVDPAGIVQLQNRKWREILSFLWPLDATGVQAAYSQACHFQDSGLSMPVPSPMAFALLAIISTILAHFSHRLSLYLPCPWGEIWLHLSNKLENWAIIERIRSMWAVYLTYAGQKAQRSFQN